MIITSVQNKRLGNGCGTFTYHYYNGTRVNKHDFKSSVYLNVRTFYYHNSWLPQLGDTPDPQFLVEDYNKGQLTHRQFLQELIFLVDLYQEYRYLDIYNQNQFERSIKHLNKILSNTNIIFDL